MSIPLAFAALDLSSESFDLANDVLQKASMSATRRTPPPAPVASHATASTSNQMAIFTTAQVREQFLAPQPQRRSLTLDVFKEEYYRLHVPYGAIIYREARRNDLSPELVAAIVQTESDFRPHLVSHKSAQGLMQIIPDTARLLGMADPFDPEENIAAGTRYFRYLLNRFNNETMALAAYNAGEGNVERFGGIPPFQETRDYITKVHRHRHRYRQRVTNLYLATLRVRSAVE